MFGYLIWNPEGRPGVVLERRNIGGANFWVLEVRGRERRVRRRVRRGMAELMRRGVRHCVIPPEWPAAWREGLSEIGEERLRRALFPCLLDWISTRGGLSLDGATVVLSAPCAEESVWNAAQILSRRCRYLHLRMACAESLADMLWHRYGIAAGRGGGRPALQVCFGEPSDSVPALLLGRGCGSCQKAVYGLPEAITDALQPHPVTGQLAAALWECGVVSTEEIRILSLDFHA